MSKRFIPTADLGERQASDDLARRKKSFRRYMYGLSPTEKIRQLESLQCRYYTILEAREQNNGRPIPERWKKWHRGRFEYGKANS